MNADASLSRLLHANGAVTDRYAYDAYGSLLSHDRYTGSVDQPYQYVGRLGYYTHWMEPDFTLLQLGVRFYDAQVGRFGQEDALATDSTSSYAYADLNPVDRVDPSGHKCHKVNPFHCSNFVGRCIAAMMKCLPQGGGPALKAGVAKSTFMQCTGTNGSANGDTFCARGKCTIRIWPRNGNCDCGTVLHEVMHAFWWLAKRNSLWQNIKGQDSPEHNALNNAAHNAWEYYCGRLKRCRPGTSDVGSIFYHLGIPTIGPR